MKLAYKSPLYKGVDHKQLYFEVICFSVIFLLIKPKYSIFNLKQTKTNKAFFSSNLITEEQ